jgi:hypothetical protein
LRIRKAVLENGQQQRAVVAIKAVSRPIDDLLCLGRSGQEEAQEASRDGY